MVAVALKQPTSSALSTFSAARWNVQVLTAGQIDGTGADAPEWTWVYGITKFEPSQDATTQDDTDIFSGGFKSNLVTATSEDVSLEGMIKGPRSTSGATVDPGAAFIRSKRRKIGEENIIVLRYWRSDNLTSLAVIQTFSVKWKDVGGSQEDLQKYTADLGGRGAPIEVARPSQTIVVLDLNGATAFTPVVDGADGTPVTNAATASATTVQSAIAAASTVGVGNVIVEGSAGGPFTVTLRQGTTLSTTGTTGGTPTVADPA